MLQLPSPLQKVNWSVANVAGVEVWLKRDDLIHSEISGNKWRKLVYNMQQVKEEGYKGLVTFGGAFSNHIAATAHAGKLHGIETAGIIRGEEADFENPTLGQARKNGMELIPVSREQYQNKKDPHHLAELQVQFPDYLIVPEGGANLNGVLGCMEILKEVNQDIDVVACPIGTSTTFSGLVASAGTGCKVLGFPAVKGGDYLRADVNNFLDQLNRHEECPPNLAPSSDWQFQSQYHFGGFAKMKEPLVRFMNAFWEETQIPLDPIYTAKMFFGLKEMIQNHAFEKGTRILAIHTGGLQGIAGMNARLSNKNYSIDYAHKI
jgi:1-aminocyclopropane-1-carboxylate deaminase